MKFSLAGNKWEKFQEDSSKTFHSMTDTSGTGLLADRVCTYEISHSLNHYKKNNYSF